VLNDPLGCIGIGRLSVRPADTSLAQGINDLPSVGLPTLTSLCEAVINSALMEFLDADESTVTLSSNLRVLGFAGVGSELQASARCIEYQDNELKFELEVYCADREICVGDIKRKVVDRVMLTAKIAAQILADNQN
jgi:fluoroacetyl-CoA thioesterase